MNEQHPKQGNYDKPIEKPYEELPKWFVEMLNARFTTKRSHQDHSRTATTNAGRRSQKAL